MIYFSEDSNNCSSKIVNGSFQKTEHNKAHRISNAHSSGQHDEISRMGLFQSINHTVSYPQWKLFLGRKAHIGIPWQPMYRYHHSPISFTNEFCWSYLQEYRWVVMYKAQNDSKTAVTPKFSVRMTAHNSYKPRTLWTLCIACRFESPFHMTQLV